MSRDTFRLLGAAALVLGVVIADTMHRYREHKDAEDFARFRTLWERARSMSAPRITVNDREYSDADSRSTDA